VFIKQVEEMDDNQIAKLARIAEAYARIANLNAAIAEMQTANAEREREGLAQAYNDDAFAAAPTNYAADVASIRDLVS
jgi:hypothetical protein